MKGKIFIAFCITTLMLLFSCKKPAGEEAAVSQAGEVAKEQGQSLAVNTAQSVINWEGAKPTGTHTGTIKISEGNVFVDKNTIVGGAFTIDMNSIENTDLSGDMKVNLENHLKGIADDQKNDFFNVRDFPTAKFEITKVTKVNGDDTATHLIYGNMTIKDVTKEIGFKALVGMGDGRIKVTTPPFTIDRTLWGVNYGSKTVFDNLGDKFINDEIGLSLDIEAGKPIM